MAVTFSIGIEKKNQNNYMHFWPKKQKLSRLPYLTYRAHKILIAIKVEINLFNEKFKWKHIKLDFYVKNFKNNERIVVIKNEISENKD